ncbi:MAG TPA: YtxH domain-containing protein [Pyrinomonadaceae bacterium]|jgi:gas vesicle protein
MTDQRLRKRDERESELSTQVTCLLLGGAIGALVALLFAPKAGRELRGDIADVTRKGVDRTRETASQLGTKAGEYYETASQKAGDLVGSARDVAARRGEHLSAAIEAGKRAYTEEKRRTESGSMQPAPTYYEGEPKS